MSGEHGWAQSHRGDMILAAAGVDATSSVCRRSRRSDMSQTPGVGGAGTRLSRLVRSHRTAPHLTLDASAGSAAGVRYRWNPRLCMSMHGLAQSVQRSTPTNHSQRQRPRRPEHATRRGDADRLAPRAQGVCSLQATGYRAMTSRGPEQRASRVFPPRPVPPPSRSGHSPVDSGWTASNRVTSAMHTRLRFPPFTLDHHLTPHTSQRGIVHDHGPLHHRPRQEGGEDPPQR